MMKLNRILYLIFTGLLSIAFPSSAQEYENNGTANEYMNRSDFSQLVQRFESESRLEEQKLDDVIALFGDISGKTIMDIGAGTGLFTFRMAETAKKMIAGDVDDRFLELVRFRIDTMSNNMIKSRIESRKIPYDNPGLERSEVDGVLLVNTYHHIQERVEYLKKLKHGIRKGGRILIVDFFKESTSGPPRNHRLAMKVVIEELEDAGYSEIQTNTQILEQQYIVIVDVN